MKKSLVIFLLFLIIIFKMHCVVKSNDLELFSPICSLIVGITNTNELFINTTCGNINSMWTQLTTPKFQDIAVTNNNDIYGLGLDQKIYYKEYSTNNQTTFKIISGLLTKISVDKISNTPILVGINSSNTGYYADAGLTSNPNWVQMTSLPNNEIFKQIAISNQKLYAISRTDNIYYGQHYKNPNWKKVHGSLSQLSIENNIVVGVNSGGNIYYTENLENPNWIHLRGFLRYIWICNNMIYGVNDNGIYYNNYYNNSNWLPVKWDQPSSKGRLIQIRC
jgi:hypothetical protein